MMVAQKIEMETPTVAKKRGFFAKKRHTLAPTGGHTNKEFVDLLIGGPK